MNVHGYGIFDAIMVAFDTLIHTKIRIPALHRGLISRKRLLDHPDSGLEKRITLLSAPAGCGKTSLLGDWISHQMLDMAFAWVALDENDNDPSLFLPYVIAALQTIDPDMGRGILPVMRSPNSPPTIDLLPSILNQIN